MAGREVRVAVLGDASSLKRALADAQGATDRYERETARSTGRIAGAWAGVSASMTSFVTNAVGSFVSDSYRAGVDIEQAWTRVQGVFGETAKGIDEFARKSAKSIGLSRLESLRATGTFGNLLVQLGFTSDEAGSMSTSMTTAAASLAAFHGADPTEVIEAMSAAFRGEYDALQRYVPAISDAALKQHALAMTGKANADELTNQEKAAAAYSMMLQGLGPAQNVFNDGIQTAAERQMFANAQWEDAKARLGEMLIPAGTWLMENFAKLLEWWMRDMQPNFERGIGRLQELWANMGDTVATVSDAVRTAWEWIETAWNAFQRFRDFVSNGMGEQMNSFIDGMTGGLLGGLGDLLGFDSGGVVPGPVGAPQLAVVHGGETVVPTHKDPMAMGGVGGGPIHVHVDIDGREIARAVVDQVRAA